MIAILTGDIIHSRKLINQEIWLNPLKALFTKWGKTPAQWEIFRGDSFQLEVADPLEALKAAIRIKATIRSLMIEKSPKRNSDIDVRMAIGIGEKSYAATRISESNGTAFVHSGNRFESLKTEKRTLAVASLWPAFDTEMNLYLKLACIQMDNWPISSGELMNTILVNPNKTQSEIGGILGIAQNSVSKRYQTAQAETILEMEQLYRKKLKALLP